jgi:hypothetical protein
LERELEREEVGLIGATPLLLGIMAPFYGRWEVHAWKLRENLHPFDVVPTAFISSLSELTFQSSQISSKIQSLCSPSAAIASIQPDTPKEYF